MSYTPIPAGTPDWDVPVNAAFTDQDGRITNNTANIATQATQISNLQANDVIQDADIDALQTLTATHTSQIATNTSNIATNTANIATHTSQISTLQTQVAQAGGAGWLPSDQGLIAWTMDPSEAANQFALVSGTLYFLGVWVRANATLTNVVVPVNAAGVTLTAGQNLAGVYNAAGTRVAVSADQSGNWTTTGNKTVAMTAPVALTPGLHYIAILSNGTTPIGMLRETNIGTANPLNYNLTATNARVATLAGQTSLPASVTFSTRTIFDTSIWSAIS